MYSNNQSFRAVARNSQWNQILRHSGAYVCVALCELLCLPLCLVLVTNQISSFASSLISAQNYLSTPPCYLKTVFPLVNHDREIIQGSVYYHSIQKLLLIWDEIVTGTPKKIQSLNALLVVTENITVVIIKDWWNSRQPVDISLRHHWFPREMKSEERAQKFHADDV